MLGWKLFAKAVTLITDNLGLALRVSLVPLAIGIGAFVLMLGGVGVSAALFDPTRGTAALEQAFGAGAVLGLLATLVVLMAVTIWVAVAWHRATLLEEPVGWLPPFHGGPVLGYLGRSILLGLVALVVWMGVALVVGLVAAVVPPLAVLLGVAAMIFVLVLVYRLALILPAGAVERPIPLGAAWEATKGASGAILLLAVLTFLLSFVLQLPAILVGGTAGAIGEPTAVFAGGALSMVYGLVVQWIVFMVGISVLTVLYGHFVERRPL